MGLVSGLEKMAIDGMVTMFHQLDILNMIHIDFQKAGEI